MPWRQTRGVEVQLHLFLTNILDGGGWSTSRLDYFNTAKWHLVRIAKEGGTKSQSNVQDLAQNRIIRQVHLSTVWQDNVL
jgi:hypothetical protein